MCIRTVKRFLNEFWVEVFCCSVLLMLMPFGDLIFKAFAGGAYG